jgi:hypothetical protein
MCCTTHPVLWNEALESVTILLQEHKVRWWGLVHASKVVHMVVFAEHQEDEEVVFLCMQWGTHDVRLIEVGNGSAMQASHMLH